jgi:FtsH-binding integral membrane protein
MESACSVTDPRNPVALGSVDTRATFISRTYAHLMGAIVAFTLLEVILFSTGVAERIALALTGVNWMLVLGAFMLVGWLASRAAHTAEARSTQYLALAGFVSAEVIIFVPLLYVANTAAPGAIDSAAATTLLGFGGLTGVAFMTRKDFSFLRGILLWAGILALLAIAGGVFFGFQLGTYFPVAMVGFAGAAILYDTSNVLHHHAEDRHVAAALELFASVALMFWYVLQLFLSSDD